jgi:hypothetical protein
MTQEADRQWPWESNPTGVVSLLAMLEFAAQGGAAPLDTLAKIGYSCRRLGMPVTQAYVDSLLKEIVKSSPPASVQITDQGFRVKDGQIPMSRYVYYAEVIYSTLRAELSTKIFRSIPSEKVKYLDPKWLTEGLLFKKYQDMVDEFQRAGRCFAYGENTACVFHLMRVTDFCLRKVAESVGAVYTANNWKGIGDKINEKMQEKYQSKTDAWKQSEPFYAEVLTDIQAISRGHRNPILHELEKTYDEGQAIYMLTVIESFANRVADKL